MRALVTLLALLLALAPLGLAQSGSGDDEDRSDSPDSTDCGEADCQESDDSGDGNETGNRTDDGDGEDNETDKDDEDDDRFGPGCRDGNRSDDQLRRCRQAVADIGQVRGRDWISFRTDPVNATLLDYRIVDLLALEAIHLDLQGENLTLQRSGSTLFVRDGGAELRLHDEPNGLIRFKGEGNVSLVFPDDTTIEPAANGARATYPDGRQGHLLAENATWLANDTVALTGFFAFHVPVAQALRDHAAVDRSDEEEEAKEAKERVQEAIERRTVGAEVTLRAPGQRDVAMAAAGPDVEILAYDDVEVEVDLPDAVTPDSPMRVVVSSELTEGRTIVLNVDEALLASSDPEHLILRYFDLRDDGTETEVVFGLAAGGLQDILDPADDGGQPEYWVVQDANGLQVLVSVPHWSVHAITVASLVTTLHTPSVLVGIAVGAGMTVALGIFMLIPRRRDDDY